MTERDDARDNHPSNGNWGPFDGDATIPLGAPSTRFYPFVETDRGTQHLAICADHYAAERELMDWVDVEEGALTGIDVRTVAPYRDGHPPTDPTEGP